MSERFIPLYEWATRLLPLPEALVVSRIKMWGNAGCWESYKTLSERLGLDRRTVMRAVKRLLKKDLIKVQLRKNNSNLYTFNFGKLIDLPLHKLVSESHQSKAQAVSQSHQIVPQSHPTIYSQDIKEKTRACAVILTTQDAKGLSQAEFNDRRREQLQSLFERHSSS